jgi:hypothetical protein
VVPEPGIKSRLNEVIWVSFSYHLFHAILGVM